MTYRDSIVIAVQTTSNYRTVQIRYEEITIGSTFESQWGWISNASSGCLIMEGVCEAEYWTVAILKMFIGTIIHFARLFQE